MNETQSPKRTVFAHSAALAYLEGLRDDPRVEVVEVTHENWPEQAVVFVALRTYDELGALPADQVGVVASQCSTGMINLLLAPGETANVLHNRTGFGYFTTTVIPYDDSPAAREQVYHFACPQAVTTNWRRILIEGLPDGVSLETLPTEFKAEDLPELIADHVLDCPACSAAFGYAGAHLVHDIHERLTPRMAFVMVSPDEGGRGGFSPFGGGPVAAA